MYPANKGQSVSVLLEKRTNSQTYYREGLGSHIRFRIDIQIRSEWTCCKAEQNQWHCLPNASHHRKNQQRLCCTSSGILQRCLVSGTSYSRKQARTAYSTISISTQWGKDELLSLLISLLIKLSTVLIVQNSNKLLRSASTNKNKYQKSYIFQHTILFICKKSGLRYDAPCLLNLRN